MSFLSQFVFLRRPFSLKSLWIVYWISPCSVLQALHKIPDSFYHRIGLVSIKRPLGCSLTYALRVYIGISIIAKRYLLQNTSVENVESSCKGRPFSPRMHLQADFFAIHRRLSDGEAAWTGKPLVVALTLSLPTTPNHNNQDTAAEYRKSQSLHHDYLLSWWHKLCVCALPLYTVDLILSTKI